MSNNTVTNTAIVTLLTVARGCVLKCLELSDPLKHTYDYELQHKIMTNMKDNIEERIKSIKRLELTQKLHNTSDFEGIKKALDENAKLEEEFLEEDKTLN